MLCFSYEQEANPLAAGALVSKEVKSWQMRAEVVFSVCKEQPTGSGWPRV